MALFKPVPDGRVEITFMDGQQLQYMYADIDRLMYPTPHLFAVVMPDRHRREYPTTNIRSIDLYYNSEEYLSQLTEWADEAHPGHEANDELVQQCPHCQEVIRFRSQMESFGGVVE